MCCCLQIGTLLLLAVLASLLTSRLARPDFTKLKTSDIERVEQRYKSLLKKLQDAEERLDSAHANGFLGWPEML